MRSLVMKCLALGIASMCLLGTADARQVPPELRARLQRLQERERALLNARNLLTDYLNDRESLLVPAPVWVDGVPTVVPVSLPRTNLAATSVLIGMITKETVEDVIKHLLLEDRKVRQEIQQNRIPGIDKELAELRSDFDKLMAQAGGRPSAVEPTAASGSLAVSGGLDQADVNRRIDHVVRELKYQKCSYDADPVTLAIVPPAVSGRPYTARITGQVTFKYHLLHPKRPGQQFEEWWDVKVTLGPGQGTLDRLEGPASAIEDYSSKAPDRTDRKLYNNNERWYALRQPDGSYRLAMPGIRDGVMFLLRAP